MTWHLGALRDELKKPEAERKITLELLAHCIVESHESVNPLFDSVLELERQLGIREKPDIA